MWFCNVGQFVKKQIIAKGSHILSGTLIISSSQKAVEFKLKVFVSISKSHYFLRCEKRLALGKVERWIAQTPGGSLKLCVWNEIILPFHESVIELLKHWDMHGIYHEHVETLPIYRNSAQCFQHMYYICNVQLLLAW